MSLTTVWHDVRVYAGLEHRFRHELSAGVGKTTLVQQLLTSEYLANADDDRGQSVSQQQQIASNTDGICIRQS